MFVILSVFDFLFVTSGIFGQTRSRCDQALATTAYATATDGVFNWPGAGYTPKKSSLEMPQVRLY
jgi:hypothetical protein